jgi:hypothetical protein
MAGVLVWSSATLFEECDFTRGHVEASVRRVMISERDQITHPQMLCDPSLIISEKMSCGCDVRHVLCRTTD